MAPVNRVVAVTPPKLELSWRPQSHGDVDVHMHQSFDTSENDIMSVDSAGSSPRGLLEVSSPPGQDTCCVLVIVGGLCSGIACRGTYGTKREP